VKILLAGFLSLLFAQYYPKVTWSMHQPVHWGAHLWLCDQGAMRCTLLHPSICWSSCAPPYLNMANCKPTCANTAYKKAYQNGPPFSFSYTKSGTLGDIISSPVQSSISIAILFRLHPCGHSLQCCTFMYLYYFTIPQFLNIRLVRRFAFICRRSCIIRSTY